MPMLHYKSHSCSELQSTPVVEPFEIRLISQRLTLENTILQLGKQVSTGMQQGVAAKDMITAPLQSDNQSDHMGA